MSTLDSAGTREDLGGVPVELHCDGETSNKQIHV